MQQNPHVGHRARVKQEFLQKGFDQNTPPHKVLEMLLFYAIPRKDTNEIAHSLINRFGSISGVLDASVEDLVKVKGITENTAALIKLTVPLARIYMCDRYEAPAQFKSIEDLGNFLIAHYFGYKEEVFSVTCFDSCGHLLGHEIIEYGDISSVGVSTRKIVESVFKCNGANAVISHCHPDGLALPSKADINITQMIGNALKAIGVKLCDHIIVAGNDFVSLAQSAKYRDLFI